ncbi:MAG: leucine-rich repeat domain-containing protein [Candidatus Latescibacterota bacterium]|jgi:TolB protein
MVTWLCSALLCALVTLQACGSDPGRGTGPAGDDGQTGQTFSCADSSLEAAVRTALVASTGPQAADSVLALIRLSARGRGIVDLRGIEQLQHLEVVDLAENLITDLAPLAQLPRLQSLDLTSNQVHDLSPLAGLQTLQFLALAYNPLRDLGPLLGLAQLQWLELLGDPLSQAAQDIQLPALRAHGVEIALSPAAVDSQARPDNRTRITFLSNRDDNGYQLYTVRPDGTDLRKVSDHRYLDFLHPPRFSAQRGQLAYADATSGSQRIDIYVADLDGGNPRNVTQPLLGRLAELTTAYVNPFWSPEGDRLGVRAGGGPYVGGLLMLDLNRSEPRHFFENEELNKQYYLSLSPQWDRVAYLSREGAKQGTHALYVSDTRSASPTLVVDAVIDSRFGSYYQPSYIVWSPDGQQIAFVSNRDGNQELYIVNADGSGLMRLTHDDGYDTASAWSPDGRWLAFNTNRETRWDVFVVDNKGKTTYNLTQVFSDDYVCEWLAGE